MACTDPNCNQACNCSQCCPPTPPPTPPTPPTCDGEDCVEIYDSSCVNYTGPAIPCLGIASGTNLTVVIQNMAARLCIDCATNSNLYTFPIKPEYLINGVQENDCIQMDGPISVSFSILSININGDEKLLTPYDFVITNSNLELITANNQVSIYDSNCDIVSTGHTYGNLVTVLNNLFEYHSVTGFTAIASLVSIPIMGVNTDAHFYIQYPTSNYFEIILEMDDGVVKQFKYTRDGLFYFNGSNWITALGWEYQYFMINVLTVS